MSSSLPTLWRSLLVACALWSLSARARAEALPVYVTARAADPALKVEALEVSALARAALLDAQGFDWQTADARVRGALAEARLAQQRALLALRRGRQAYLKLELETAIATLLGAMVEWGEAQAVLDSPEPVAETLMYLGASYALAENRARAKEMFTRYHVQYPQVTPNSGLFNPAIMDLWHAAGAALRQRPAGALDVRVRPASAVVSVDGAPRGTGSMRVSELAPGRHWLRVAGLGAPGSLREVTVESGRAKVEDAGEVADSAMLLDLFEHASNAKGARALAQELGVRSLGVIEVRRTDKQDELALELRSFEGDSGREQARLERVIGGDFSERSRAVRGLVAAWLDQVLSGTVRKPTLAKPASAPAPLVEREPMSSAPRDSRDEAKPVWYRRWWVWAVAGGAVAAGAVTTALVLKNRDDSPSAQQGTDRGTLTLEF
jgi:hypothetical protein